jgi:lipopolysaccharide/colanic/teichoic acid biosynthesis glycosyltransferase
MLKRAFDVFISVLVLVTLSPVLFVVVLLIQFDSCGTIFYRGERVGRYGKVFRIYKFRTMVDNAEQLGGSSTSDNDRRITKVGSDLRKYKIDELPQFINVLRGDMSVVGPRPEVRKYVDMYSDSEKMILSVRPGITDWASLANPDEGAVLAKYDDPDRAYEEIIRPEKLRLQLKYVRERSFFKDILIIFQTIHAVLGRKSSWIPPQFGKSQQS